MSEHTKEPWKFKEQGDADEYCLLTADGLRWVIAFRINGSMMPDMQRANCKRIVACVNACAGIATRELETKPLFSDGYIVIFEEVTKQRDELLAALKDLHKEYRMAVGLHSGQDDAYTVRSHNAIAKAEQS